MNTTEPTTNALAKVERAVEKRVPKPSQKQILEATAIALVNERNKQRKVLTEKASELHQKIISLAVPLAKVSVDSARIQDWGDRKITFQSEVGVATNKEIARTYAEWSKTLRAANSLVCSVDQILKQLKEASAGHPSNVVASLLNDEDIRAKLVKAGNALLTTPTSTDKASAIAV